MAEGKVQFCKKSFNVEDGSFRFVFGNGTEVSGSILDFSDDIQERLKGHGLLQKVGDSYAGAKGDYAVGIASAQDVIAQLAAGDWSAEREGGVRIADLAAAIADIKGVDVAVATAAVEKATDEQRSAWRGNAKVKAVMARLAAERAAKQLAESSQQDVEIEL